MLLLNTSYFNVGEHVCDISYTSFFVDPHQRILDFLLLPRQWMKLEVTSGWKSSIFKDAVTLLKGKKKKTGRQFLAIN